VNIYVETNFVLELVFEQEQHASCEQILALCESGQPRLIIPAYCLAEPHEKLTRQAGSRRELQRNLETEVRQLARTASYTARINSIQDIASLLVRSNEEEKQRFIRYRERLLSIAEIIPLTIDISSDPGNPFSFANVIGNFPFTDLPAAKVTGRGTGIDDVMLTHKTEIVATAVARAEAFLDPLSILSEVGGLEIAALAGFIVSGAAHRVPVVIDGVIALAALVVADALVPGIASHVIAGHRSTEPGASAALEHLGLEPLLDLGMRLGEGTGACLAIPVVQCAARILTDMATLDTLTTSA